MAATAKELALKGCEIALQDALAKLMLVLARELVSAKTLAGKQKCLERFEAGVQFHKSTYEQAVAIVAAL